jgi:HAD superfamily phosphatase
LLNVEILKHLKQDYPMGIVTGRPKQEARYVLNHFKTEVYFQVLITMDDLPRSRQKPDPLGIMMAMDQLGVKAAYYFGDSTADMMAAREAGIIAIGVVTNNKNKKSQKKSLLEAGAFRTLNSVNDILEVIND